MWHIMMNTFDNYLNEPYALNFNQMQSLHSDLLDEISGNPDAVELYDDLIDVVTKYAAIRAVG